MTDLQSRIAALSPQQRALLESRAAGMVADQGTMDQGGITPRDRSRPTPLSFAQQREWALERFRPSNNIIGALRLEGDLDLDLLARVITEITARHEVLRSTVELIDGKPVQVVQPVTPVPLPVVDLRGFGPQEQADEVRRCYDTEVTRPFPQEQATKLRATVLRLDDQTYVGLLIMHHAASDGWSASIVVREAVLLYQAFLAGEGTSLVPLPIQYGDFAAWQRERLDEERMAAALAYWKETLADIPPRLELPTERPHPVRRTFAADQHAVELSADTAVAVRRFAEAESISIAMIMAAVSSVVFHRYTGQDDIVLGSAITGRVRTETEQLIGCFANALPLRLRVDRSQTLREVLHQSRDVVSAAFAHQDIPFDRLIEELAPREASQTPLIQMMVNVLTSPGEISRPVTQTHETPRLRISPEPVELGPIPIDLILIVQPRPEAMSLLWHYSSELFDHDTVARLAEHFEYVLAQLVGEPDRRVGDIELAAPVSAEAVAPLPAPHRVGTGVVERFQRRAALAPDDPAVVCDGVAMSYADLNRDANRLARRLRSLGVGAEQPVGVLVDRSPLLAVAVLGVLKAGGAYVPIDPDYPAERIDLLLADAGAPVVITTGKLASLAGTVPTVLVDEPGEDDGTDLSDPPALTSAAYVVYTSGSTGQPKGVVIEHRSLVTFAAEVAERLGLGAGDRFLQFASPSFDVLAEELFPVWLAGGAVVFPPADMTGLNIDVDAVTERDRVSVMELPAAFWHEWVLDIHRTGRTLPPSLRLVIVGSERVLPERLAMWQRLEIPLMNVYGITETTVSSTFFRLGRHAPEADLQRLPIGTPLPSVRLQILDSDLRPVPVGGVGELYIGGISVGRGYLKRPEWTAQRFIADPDPACPGERIYRTGDLVRQRGDGNLEFLSRGDTQIKIRGFRVEPTEIESAICRHPQVAQAVVTVHEPAPGRRRLVGYLVPEPRTRVLLTDLRRFLAQELPHYLIPAAFVSLERLPLTANGKIDFERLPEPTEERPELPEEMVPPSSEAEHKLAAIVAAVLGVTQVGANDNFFELGGDSIQAIQVAARAKDEGLPLSPLDLFEHPTVALLAQRSAAGADKPGSADPASAPAGPAAAAGRPDTAGAAQAEPAAPEEPAAAATPATPADFPLARVDQSQLDTLLGRIGGGGNG
ncbi:amino acid adenylation domain-containing protein [Micromonospora sp. RTGN7]|uniref:non-ribosomal peptide synthetase n=1 Tax=Micromonospora sp. RTGN7 TaxID=3016526 RepID=UPI0029FF483D|nr:amino acid adenylation domain-containing protein [Micromonospora sp. RTGN7]